MSTPVRTLILDFDGTIGDTSTLIVKTLADTLEALGFPPRTQAEYVSTIALPLPLAFQQLGVTPEDSLQCTDHYVNVQFPKNKSLVPVLPFPGVVDTLREIHRQGITLTIATNRRAPSLIELLKAMDIYTLFSYIVTVVDVPNPKPAGDMALHILRQTSSQPLDTMVVGDTSLDILMGKNARCRTCGVTYGNGSRESLMEAGADCLIDQFHELIKLCV